MKYLLSILLLLGSASAAVTIANLPTQGVIYEGGTQSVCAQVTGSANGAVTWSVSPNTGTLVAGTAGCEGWTAPNSTGTWTLTATSVADGTKTAATTITVLASPTALTSHPLLWVTAAQLPTLRSTWSVSGNFMYNNLLKSQITSSETYANLHWTWSVDLSTGATTGGCGCPDAGWQDIGGSNGVPDPTESYAQVFAMAALISPVQADRKKYGRMARDMIMWIPNKYAANGFAYTATGTPWTGDHFMLSDRMRYYGSAWGTTLDWLQYNGDTPGCAGFATCSGYLSTSADTRNPSNVSDVSAFQQTSLLWGGSWIGTAITSGINSILSIPTPIASTGTSILANPDTKGVMSSSNYWLGPERNLLLLGAAIDAANDPKANGANAVNYVNSSTGAPNTMRAMLNNAQQAWLFQSYAQMEDGNISATILGVPSYTTMGTFGGGFSLEGTEYQNAFLYRAEALLGQHTSGIDDPLVTGVQANLVNSKFWDYYPYALAHTYSPNQDFPDTASGFTYVPYEWGDIQKYQMSPTNLAVLMALNVLDVNTGRTDRVLRNRWMVENMTNNDKTSIQTNLAYYYSGTTAYNYTSEGPILMYLGWDPATTFPTTTGTDQRTTFPNVYSYNSQSGNAMRVTARDTWDNTGFWVTYGCVDEAMANHTMGQCGQFAWFRNGEWLLKPQDAYGQAFTPPYVYSPQSWGHNTMTIMNPYTGGHTCTPDGQAAPSLCAAGSQYTIAEDGPPTNLISGSNWGTYMAAYTEMAGLYNDSNYGATGVSAASRDWLWLNPSVMVVYDRDTTTISGSAKTFNVTTPFSPSISGLTAHMTGTSQHAYVQALDVQGTGTLGISSGAAPFNGTINATFDPVQYIVQSTDSANPNNARMLTLMQVVTTAGTQAVGSVVHSSSGVTFDGTTIGTTCAWFKNTIATTFTSTTIPASSCTTHYVADLTPGVSYTPTCTGCSGTPVADSAGVISFAATGTGNIVLAPSSVNPATCSITLPTAGATVSGTSVSLQGSGTPGQGSINNITYTLDGSTTNMPAACGSSPCNTTFNSTLFSNTSHTLAGSCTDSGGGSGTISGVSITISNTSNTVSLTGKVVVSGKVVIAQ